MMHKRLSFSDKLREYEGQGDQYFSNHKIRSAIAEYTKAILLSAQAEKEYLVTITEQIASIYAKRAKAYISLNDYENAIHDFTQVINNIAVNTDDSSSQDKMYFARGCAYLNHSFSLDRNASSIVLAKALDDFNEIILLGIETREVYSKRGKVYFCLNRYQEAIEDYEQALSKSSMKSDKAQLHFNCGMAYLKNKNFDHALSHFYQVSLLDSAMTGAYAYYYCAMIYFEQENYREAIGSCNDYLKNTHEPDPAVYVLRGRAQAALGKRQEAIADFEKAISIDDAFLSAYLYRGQMYYLLKQYEKSKADLDKVIALDGCQGEAYYHRGNIFYIQENFLEAIVDFKKALECRSSLSEYIQVEIQNWLNAIYEDIEKQFSNPEKLKGKKPSELLQLMKEFPEDKRTTLFIQCLNKHGALGEKLWEKEPWSWKEPSLDAGILRDICEELKELVGEEIYLSIIKNINEKNVSKESKEISYLDRFGLSLKGYFSSEDKVDRAENSYTI